MGTWLVVPGIFHRTSNRLRIEGNSPYSITPFVIAVVDRENDLVFAGL